MRHDGGEVMRVPIAQKERHTPGRQQLRDVMQHGLRHRQGAVTDLDAQQQFGLGINRGPDPVGRTREPLDGLGFAHVTVSHRTEDGVEFVELDLIDVQLVQKVGGKGFELLGGLHQPTEDRIGIDLEHPRRAPDAQAFGQTRDDAHDELHRGALAMKDRAVRLSKISLAGDTLQLAPGLTTGMTIGAEVAASEPAVVGAIGLRTEVRLGVDGAPASSGEGDDRRGQSGALGRASAPCSQAAQSGLWISPGKGWGSWERLRRAGPAEGRLGVGLGASGHQTWIRRQTKTRATRRSW